MEPPPSLDTLSDDLPSISFNSTTTTTRKHTHTPSTQTLTLEDIPELRKRLESIYYVYTDDISRCPEKCLEGNLDVPTTWLASQEIIKFPYLKDS
ncbi:hypothetical protein Tco_1126072 [Tanacetum coccineum]